MILQEARDKIRDLMSIFVYRVICASEMGQIDIKKDAETVLTPLLAEVYDYKNLRNLNETERANYPAVDLADDDARVAFQVTSQKDLNKVKKTLRTFVEHELYKKYDTLFIYVLTEKQGSYSAAPCNEIVQGRFNFDTKNNILSYRDLLKRVGTFEVGKTSNILEILEANIGEGKIFQSSLGHSTVPMEVVDEHIDKEIDRLRKARFFSDFDEVEAASVLGTRVSEGELRSGSSSLRAQALAWCARILLANQEDLTRAEEFINRAKTLGGDTRIAEAFINSQKGDRKAALGLLANVGSSDPQFTAYRSASFKIVGNLDGSEEAIAWLDDVGLADGDLDPEGKLVLLSYQFELGQWDAAGEIAGALSDRDLEEAPVLHFMKAMAYLLKTVPVEFRNLVFYQVPLESANFPMDSRADAIEARRTAQLHFTAAAEAAMELNCNRVATIPERYALWLDIEDPEYCDSGRQRLAAKLDDLESALYLVPLGLQYGVISDLADIDHEIRRQIALSGDVLPDVAFASLARARMQKDPESIADYIARHFDTIVSHIDEIPVRRMQTEAIALAGKPKEAKKQLKQLQKEGLSDVENSRLRIVIAKAEGRETLEARRKLFRQTDSLVDLEALVGELGVRQEWSALCEYGEVLFEETHSLQDMARLADALHASGRSAQAIELLESNAYIMSQSVGLEVLYCWALFHEGQFLRARRKLARLEVDWEDENYRTLQVSLAVAIGDWDYLSVCVAREYQAIEKRGVHELIKATQLALCVNSPYAKQLALAAAAKDENDASALAAIYFLATEAGWESERQFVECLRRAVKLSGDDGPFLKFTIQDILDKKPDWDRQESSAREVLSRGEAPMALAGLFLSKSLISFVLFPALANSAERDLRRKVGIPAVSGQRQPAAFLTRGTIGLDYTTLLTLSFLGLLDTVIDVFDTIYVPHSALTWLFNEKQSASFHQPSRIRGARRVLDLMTAGSLEKIHPSARADRELSDYVGDDLATFVAEAENTKRGDTQRLVVRPFPVLVAGSLGEDEADLSRYFSVLSSCQALVEKLYDMGEIIESEEKDALAYLQLQEKPWPRQPAIANGAILYLDDLAVYYFLHSNMLEKLIEAEFRIIVSPNLISESNALIGYEGLSGQVIDTIENTRSAVSQGIYAGQVKAGEWRHVDASEGDSIADRQMADVFVLVEDCDAIIADDRFLNQWPHVEHNGSQVPLFTTLDLLDALEASGSMTSEVRMEKRTNLRRAGYFFVPVSEDELTCHLNAAEVRDGRVKENIHLRSIRESILQVRMNDWLQLPREESWLDGFFEVSLNVLRNNWKGGADVPSVEARSDWILDLIDVRGWAHFFELENRDEAIKAGRARISAKLLTSLDPNVPPDIREAYWEWLEDRFLVPIKEFEPDLYTLIVDFEKRRISEVVGSDLTKVEDNDENSTH